VTVDEKKKEGMSTLVMCQESGVWRAFFISEGDYNIDPKKLVPKNLAICDLELCRRVRFEGEPVMDMKKATALVEQNRILSDFDLIMILLEQYFPGTCTNDSENDSMITISCTRNGARAKLIASGKNKRVPKKLEVCSVGEKVETCLKVDLNGDKDYDVPLARDALTRDIS
jgi:hypothetical protein